MGSRPIQHALGLAVMIMILGACGSDGSTPRTSACDPADAARPDHARREVAGVVMPAVPRRTCTRAQEGCVAEPNSGQQQPPAPGVQVSRVTGDEIHFRYDLGSGLGGCRPASLSVAVYTSVSGQPPDVHETTVAADTGSVRINLRHIPGMEEYGAPDMMFVRSNTAEGLAGELAGVELPAPEGERRLSEADRERLFAQREACRADIDDRTSCPSTGTMAPTSGPVRGGAAAEFTQSVRESLEADAGMPIVDLRCADGSRCDATFAVGGQILGMSYRIEALTTRADCWELKGFEVTQPVPELGGLAAPLPTRGCVGQ